YLRFGFTRQRKLLPFHLNPLPREVRIAYEHDREQWRGKVRVRYLELRVELSRKERADIARRSFDQPDPGAWQKQEHDRIVQERLRGLLAEREGGKSFAAAAAERGADVERQRERWTELAQEDPDSAVDRFLHRGEAGRRSEPVPTAGGYRILHLLEREEGRIRGLDDPEVWRHYAGSPRRLGVIRRLRSRKALAWMLLDALDRTSLQPARVRDAIRQDLVADLEGAERKLRELGLH
ncbi:MAG: hypothetical protein ACE5JG_05915, partial [Planctomycetota bacterium]